MGTINIQSTDLSHKAGLTYTGTSDKTIDVNSLVTKVSSTDNAIVRFDGTSGAVQNSSVVIYDSGNVSLAQANTMLGWNTEDSFTPSGGNPVPNYGFARGAYGTNTVGISGFSGIGFYASSTERMRIDSSGNLLVGTAAQQGGVSAKLVLNVPTASVNGALTTRVDTTSSTTHIFFQNPNNTVGSISTSGSSTSYNTSSDYRLKEDYQDMVGATDRLKALKPINFAWKADSSRVDGFLAHELQEVVPEAATGTKDAMREEEYIDENGDTQTREVPDYQGIDQSKLVPLLTKALQEAVEKIEQLEARIKALEAK